MNNLIKLIVKKNFQNFLRYFRIFILNEQREENLANILYKIINKKNINICDYGSGFNPKIIKLLSEKIKFNNIHCFDYYNNAQILKLNNNDLNIKFIKIKDYEKIKIKYDIVLLIDVMHHIGVKNKLINKILIKLKKNCKLLIIKDVFEYSKFDRALLIIMDFIGNYSYNVKIPKLYFTEKSFKETLINCNFKDYKIIKNLRIYSKKFLFFSKKKFHFICIVSE